jgi:hypothetical protein
MKLQPIFNWWQNKFNEPVKMQIGYRANEGSRAKTMLSKTNQNGFSTFKAIVGKRKTQNKWADIEWQKPMFPLIDNNIYKDKIEKYWKDKPVRFAYMNNCVGCFHRTPILLKHLSDKHPNKYQWFIDAEQDTATFKNGMNYEQIKNSFKQTKLFEDDFNECDSGYCGL